jgi:hypothetical protein
MEFRLDPGRGVRLVPEYDPKYVYPPRPGASFARAGMSFIQFYLESVGSRFTMIMTVNVPREKWCYLCSFDDKEFH